MKMACQVYDTVIILPMMRDLGIEMEIVKSPVSIGIEDRILHIETIESLDAYKKHWRRR